MSRHEPFVNRVTSRKFISYVTGITLATIYLYTRPDAFETWAQFVLMLTGIYAGANVLHTAAKQLGVRIDRDTRATPEVPFHSGPPSLPDDPEQQN